MNEKMKDYFKVIPYSVPLIYFFGFILINGYLNNYNYSDYDILNVTYLKAGTLFVILLTIIFITTRLSYDKETMTDDIGKSWESILLAFHNILLVTYLIFIYLIGTNIFDSIIVIISIAILVLFYFIYRLWFDNKEQKSNKRFLFLIILGIVILLTINLIYALNNKFALYLLVFNIALFLMITISLGSYGDKNYTNRIVTDFLLIVVSCFIFGSKIYGMIPSKIGGGESYKIIIDNNCLYSLLEIDTVSINEIDSDTLNVIYENDKHFIFEKEERTFVVDKHEIKCFYLLNDKQPPTQK